MQQISSEETFETESPKTAEVQTPPPAQEPKKPSISPALIAVTEDGKLLPKDHIQLDRMIQTYLEGGGFPKHLDTMPKARMAYQMALQLNIPPLLAVRNIAIINGSPSLFGDLPKGLCEATGELEKCKEYLIAEDYRPISVVNKNLDAALYAAVCEIKRKGRDEQTFHFTVAEAKTAGLWMKKGYNGKDTPWVNYPQTMLMRRARSIALRAEFADVLAGVNIAEYDNHALVTEGGQVLEPHNVTAEINETYLTKESTTDAKTPEVLPAEPGR
jgi:hypothetical protein